MPNDTTDKRLTDPDHVGRLAAQIEHWSETPNEGDPMIDALLDGLPEAAATLRALSAKLQEPVEVKPLEWTPTIISDRHLRDVAHGLDGLIAYEVGVEVNYVLVNGRGLGIKQLGTFPSTSDAKAAAQADYEARVRAMLADRGE